MKFKPQVNEGYYNPTNYFDLQRFISYYHQIDIIKRHSNKKDQILEIGVGDGTLSTLLKHQGFRIKTCDFDQKLKPDYVEDIRQLHFSKNSFDLVIAFEVLEHIPFEDFKKALKELHRVCSKRTIISIPYYTISVYGMLKLLPFVKPNLFLIRLIEKFFIRHKFNGQHYWVMGKQGFSRRRIRKILNECGFKIRAESSPKLNPVHYFFVLEKIR